MGVVIQVMNGTQKDYDIDVLFKKLDIPKAYDIDILLKELGIPKVYDIDVLFKKLGISKTYSIDVLLKKQSIIPTYSIDSLFKKSGISSAYSIDFLITSIPATTTMTNAGGTLSFTPLTWSEGQKCNVAVRPIPLKTSGAFIDTGTWVLKSKTIECVMRLTDTEKTTLTSIFNDSSLVTIYLRRSDSTYYWMYVAWLHSKKIDYQYFQDINGNIYHWFTTLTFDVESTVFAEV
jgi:hypothetical protein